MFSTELPRQQIAQLAQLPDMNPGPVLRLDREAVVELANVAARSALGGDSVVGSSWLDLCPGFDEQRWADVLAAGTPLSLEVAIGDTWIVFSHVVAPDDGSVFVFGSDITDRRRAEEALTEQSARLAEVARFPDMNPGPVLRLELDADVVLANAAARDLFGDDLVGRCWRDVCPAIDDRLWAEILDASEPLSVETRVGDRDFVFVHRRDHEGRLVFVYGSDVTRLRTAEQLVRSLLASTAEGIYGVDFDGSCTFINPAALQLLGYEDDSELLGLNMHELVHHTRPDGTAYTASECRIARALEAGQGIHVDDEVLWRKDGSSFPAEYWAYPIVQDDDLTGSVLTFLDITERRAAEEQLRSAMRAANAANAAKSQFLASMSHELRTPMNAILGYSEMLIEDAEDRGDEAALADLSKIHTAGRHLLELINAVLDLSKIEAGRMDLYPETFDVVRLLDDIASITQPLMQKAANELVALWDDSVGSMHADVTKVRQVLFNLLSNAAKFTENGTITLEARRELRGSDEWIVFSVRDTGIGIAADKLELVFEEFVQADAGTSRQYGGTGLGLALTARFCQMMGGEVKLQSAPGIGSTFTVALPANVADESAPGGEAATGRTEPAPADVATEPPVLVVDDDAHARELLTRALEADGYNVVAATGGREAVEIARLVRPALVTLDILMADMDGWAVIRAFKSDPELRDIPVVMVSIAADREAGHVLGAVESLTKPVDRAALLEVVRDHAPPGRRGVLIVEDDDNARELMRVYLEADGWTISEADTGAAALLRIAEARPDVVVLDLMMPVMDGFEFLDELRRSEEHRSIPIVVVTAKDLTDDDRVRLRGNVERIIAKGGQAGPELIRQLREVGAVRRPG